VGDRDTNMDDDDENESPAAEAVVKSNAID